MDCLPYTERMAESVVADSKVSNEGRVVIPAAVRATLGVGPGDRVRFVVEDGEVKLVSAHSLLAAVWANNLRDETGDAVGEVRAERRADIVLGEARWERLAVRNAAESRTEQEIEDSLFAQLGLPR